VEEIIVEFFVEAPSLLHLEKGKRDEAQKEKGTSSVPTLLWVDGFNAVVSF